MYSVKFCYYYLLTLFITAAEGSLAHECIYIFFCNCKNPSVKFKMKHSNGGRCVSFGEKANQEPVVFFLFMATLSYSLTVRLGELTSFGNSVSRNDSINGHLNDGCPTLKNEYDVLTTRERRYTPLNPPAKIIYSYF